MSIKAILCDFDGVLSSLDQQSAIKKIAASSETLRISPATILDRYFFTNPYAHEIDLGIMSYEKMLTTIQADCWSGSTQSWLRKWEEIWACYQPAPILRDFLRVLKAIDCIIVIITDNHLDFRAWLKAHETLAEFETHLICSAELKITKPHPKIFQVAMDLAGSTPESTCFIDDNLRNVQSAQEIGLTALHFEDEVSTLRQLLMLDWE